MHRRTFARTALAAALSVPLALCAAAPAAKAPARDAASEGRLVLAVSEGTSGGTTPLQIIDKYRPLADVIARAIHAPVIIEPARNFERLDEGMRERRYDLAMARPSDYPARAVRDYGYRYVVNAKPDGQCIFIVPKGSGAKSIADLKGHRVLLPEKVSYMARFCTAELRDAGFDMNDPETIRYTREQEVVVYGVQTSISEMGGIASYSKARKGVDAAGLREMQKSRPQPYMPLVASPKVTPTQVEAIRAELVKLEATPAGQQILHGLSITGFDGTGEKRLLDLLNWLEKK
jgi:ABC-type phosphate/phosphonate transport system substrate-binding protein